MERPDGTEYSGKGVRCYRCDVMAALRSWRKLGTPFLSMPASELPKPGRGRKSSS